MPSHLVFTTTLQGMGLLLFCRLGRVRPRAVRCPPAGTDAGRGSRPPAPPAHLWLQGTFGQLPPLPAGPLFFEIGGVGNLLS